MQSKNMLVNQYRSLSLMQGDDINKFLKSSSRMLSRRVSMKQQEEIDDISSIYTAHETNKKNLEMTLQKRMSA